MAIKKNPTQKKTTTTQRLLDEVLPCYQAIMVRIPFKEKMRLAPVIRKINEHKEIYTASVAGLVKKFVKQDDNGQPITKELEGNPQFRKYVFENSENGSKYNEEVKKINDTIIEIPPYAITEDVLESAFTSDDDKEQKQLDRDLGLIMPIIIEFIL